MDEAGYLIQGKIKVKKEYVPRISSKNVTSIQRKEKNSNWILEKIGVIINKNEPIDGSFLF